MTGAIRRRWSRGLRRGALTLAFCFVATGAQADATLDAVVCDKGAFPAIIDADHALLHLGRDLFYDPILSGNRTVACATCHHPKFGTSDGLALSIGDGGIGMGPGRRVDPENLPERRIPRNAQALFNLGYPEFRVMFHDGRVERLDNGTIRTPFGPVPDTGPLAMLKVQAILPVISPDEMAGHYSENDVSAAVRRGLFQGPDGAYAILAKRVADIPEYRRRFRTWAGAPWTPSFDDIALALAAFMAHEWRADDSPFDRFLCDGTPLSVQAEAGRRLFYGQAGCSECHSGRFQTDHRFHAIAIPQIGPGKTERFETHARDIGRQRVTGRIDDAYRFRTPSLRNVALTAPYGHSGVYADLETVIRHHLDPARGLAAFQSSSVRLPDLPGADDFRIATDHKELAAISAANVLPARPLSREEVQLLISFLHALTDPISAVGRLGVPKMVPSGLPVSRP